MKGSLLKNIPADLPEEIFDLLCSSETDHVKIERIVSRGHASPEGFWYDQEKNEFVLVVQGSAGILLENEMIVLKAGDYLNIGARVKHRVEWTDPDCDTIWLAIHY